MLHNFVGIGKRIFSRFGQTNLKIIRSGGLPSLCDFIMASGLYLYLSRRLPERRSMNSQKYSGQELVIGFLLKILTGERRLYDYRHSLDTYFFEEFYAHGKEPHRNTFRHYLLTHTGLHCFFEGLLFRMVVDAAAKRAREQGISELTIDIDQYPRKVYGRQEGAEQGFARERTKKKLFQVSVWFVRELNLVLKVELRRGKSHSITGFKKDLNKVLRKLRQVKINPIIVADSGYDSSDIVKLLFDKGIRFIFAEKQRARVKKRGEEATDVKFVSDTEIREVKYRTAYPEARFLDGVREIFIKVAETIDESGQYLFPEFFDRYTNVFVTNLDWSAREIYNHYRKHAVVEKVNEELKNDLHVGISHNQELSVNQTMTRLKAIAFNLKNLYLDHIGYRTPKDGFIKLATFQRELIHIPAIITNPKNRKILRFSPNGFKKIRPILMKFGYQAA